MHNETNFTEYQSSVYYSAESLNGWWIQNSGTLTGEKLKKKICSSKLTRPSDEFGIFDTRPYQFIVVSDDLTTANMDPWKCDKKAKKKGDVFYKWFHNPGWGVIQLSRKLSWHVQAPDNKISRAESVDHSY